MDEDTKRLKLDGVAPRTPPQTDSEDDLPIEDIREKVEIFFRRTFSYLETHPHT